MNNEISHLTASAAALLAEADEQRIRAIRSRRWVLYPRAKQALDRLSRLLDHPRGTRMPSVAIYGDSGMGKTMIMKRFRDQHPPTVQFTDRNTEDTGSGHGDDKPARRTAVLRRTADPARGTAAAASRYRPDGAGYAG